MLAWKPEERVGNFVPRGGLMQAGRKILPSKGRTSWLQGQGGGGSA